MVTFRYLPLALSDHVAMAQVYTLSAVPDVRRTLRQGVFALMAALSEEDNQYLFTCLDAGAKSMFKTLHASYVKLYKFTGQV